MMLRTALFTMTLGISLCLVSSLQAEWSWPNLNPWSSGSSAPKTSKSSSWSLLPAWGKSQPRTSQTSVLGQMQQSMNSVSQGTKNLYTKSTQALTPWKNTSNTNRSVTGYGPRTNGSTNKSASTKKSSSWLPNLSPWPDPEEKPSDVTDWLRADRPKF